jgi:hypothetical protein
LPTREARIGRNESFFRDSNELVVEESDRPYPDIICECAKLGCVARVQIRRDEYEAVREQGDRFVVAPGHEDGSVETVIERHPTYFVVRKHGQAGETALELDPRSN